MDIVALDPRHSDIGGKEGDNVTSAPNPRFFLGRTDPAMPGSTLSIYRSSSQVDSLPRRATHSGDRRSMHPTVPVAVAAQL
jgi:hypothetical protein